MSYYEHKEEWDLIDSVLFYTPKKFIPKPNVFIMDLENCMIKKISKNNLFHKINPKEIEVYDEGFLKRIKSLLIDIPCTVVIMSNAIISSPAMLDFIKTKLECAMKVLDFEFLAMFATMNNRFSKPHTGMYALLKGYFRQLGTPLQKSIVISNNSGRIISKERNGKTYITADQNDTDRAFASNCELLFQTIDEFMDRTEKEDFRWNNRCIPPEFRIQYLEKLNEYKNPSIFKEIANNPADQHIILLWGAPKSGKTTFANQLIKAWDSSDYGDNHRLIRLGIDEYTATNRLKHAKKLLESRISIIIDGYCHTNNTRQPYEELAKQTKSHIIYVELNPGIYMAELFNHWAIETSQNIEECLVLEKDYRSYNGYVSRPKNTLVIVPEINFSHKQLHFRY